MVSASDGQHSSPGPLMYLLLLLLGLDECSVTGPDPADVLEDRADDCGIQAPPFPSIIMDPAQRRRCVDAIDGAECEGLEAAVATCCP